jgi:hypothetical protein
MRGALLISGSWCKKTIWRPCLPRLPIVHLHAFSALPDTANSEKAIEGLGQNADGRSGPSGGAQPNSRQAFLSQNVCL